MLPLLWLVWPLVLGGVRGQGEVCSLYTEGVQCQDAQNCDSFLCDSGGGDEDDPTQPCAGARLKLFQTEEDYCGWCSSACVEMLQEGAGCKLTASGGQVYSMCGPGLTCQKNPDSGAALCVPMPNSDCVKKQQQYDADLDSGSLGMDQLRPACEAEGGWAAVQCSGSDVCRCVDSERGQPIFGLSTNMTSVELGLMDCQCARHAHQLREMGCSMRVKYDGDNQLSRDRFEEEYAECMNSETNDYFTAGQLRCNPNGNYDEAQCIQQTYEDTYHPGYEQEMCFCYKQGEEVDSLAPLNIASSVLECHREDDTHLAGYYRPCEAKHVQLRKLIAEYKYHGQKYISTEKLPRCSVDGYYDKVQRNSSDETEGYCSDKEGGALGSYRGLYTDMDCECAVVEAMTTGWGQKPACTEDGSYNRKQCKGGRCYCVDRFGHQCNKETPSSESLECPSAGNPLVPDKAPKSCDGS